MDLVDASKCLCFFFFFLNEMTWILFVTSLLFAALFGLLKDNSICVSASVGYHPREKVGDNSYRTSNYYSTWQSIDFFYLIFLRFKELYGFQSLIPLRHHKNTILLY